MFARLYFSIPPELKIPTDRPHYFFYKNISKLLGNDVSHKKNAILALTNIFQ